MKRHGRLKLTLPQDAPLELKPAKVTASTPILEWVTITPAVARQWLADSNRGNRTIREDHVIRLAKDMREGRWNGRNGESIRFDINDRLVNGQHRLMACIQADVPFDTAVLYGVDPESYSTIDIGMRKSFADFLGPLRGEKNAHALSAAIRIVYMWEKGQLETKDGIHFPTIAELEDTFARHPGIRDSVQIMAARFKSLRKILTPTYSTLIHYAGVKTGKQALVESFLDRLMTGLGLTEQDPVYQLRRFLLAQQGAKPGIRRAGRVYVLALVIKAWTAVSEGRSLKILKFIIGEEFPKLLG